MRIPILTALLLSTACSYDGIAIRHHGDTLDVLHTARYGVHPGGLLGAEFVAEGDTLRLDGQPNPGDPSVSGVRLTITSIEGPDYGLYSPGPKLGQGVWITREGLEIGIDGGGEIEIEGRLEWAGPIKE